MKIIPNDDHANMLNMLIMLNNIKLLIIRNMVSVLLIVLFFVNGHAEYYDAEDYYCFDIDNAVVPQCGNCWQISIEYAGNVFGGDAWQGMIADFACKNVYTIGLPVGYHPTCFPACGLNCLCYYNWYIPMQYVAMYMDLMGFTIETISGPTSIEDLSSDFCSVDNYCYLIEASGVPIAHVFAVSGLKEEEGIIYLYVNDIDDDDRWKTYSEVRNDWNSSIKTCGWIPSSEWLNYVSIDEIAAFSVNQYSNVAVELQFQIDEAANPSDIAAVYIVDNTLGPARLIETLVGVPVLEPAINTWYDTLLQYDDNYYYYLLHGCSAPNTYPIDKLRETDAGGPLHFIASETRPLLNSPTNLVVSDYPMDAGEAIQLNWQLSQDDALIDCYNIYRAESEIYTMRYLTSIGPGVSAYIDNDVIFGMQYWYRISAAHHGGLADVPSGFYAIWNEVTDNYGPVQPVDNLSNIISFPSTYYDSLLFCPAGNDADTLRVCVQVMGEDSVFASNIPKDSITLIPFDCPDAYFCDDNPITATHNTDEFGMTEFSVPNIGGCDSIYVYASVLGRQSSNYLIVYSKSPDINGDGMVSLADLSLFAHSYNKGPSDPGYCPCCDFTWDDYCSLADLSFFAKHYHHTCPQGAQQAASSIYNESEYAVNIIIDVNDNDNSVYAKVVLENIYDITIIGIVLNNNIPGYNFVEWIPSTDLQITSIALPVINNYREIIFLAAYSEIAMAGDYLELGALVYQCENNEALLTTQNTSILDRISIISAEALNKDNEIITLQGTTIFENAETEVPNINYLTNNYPNPFNPSTTIEYGISKDSWVSINIYDISGRLIKVLINEMQKAGNYRICWDGKDHKGKDVASGIYFCKLNTEKYERTIKLVLLR